MTMLFMSPLVLLCYNNNNSYNNSNNNNDNNNDNNNYNNNYNYNNSYNNNNSYNLSAMNTGCGLVAGGRWSPRPVLPEQKTNTESR